MNSRGLLFTIAVLCSLTCLPANADEPVAAAVETVTPVCESLLTVPWSETWTVSPDRRYAYVGQHNVQTINLWQVLACRWFDLLGLLWIVVTFMAIRYVRSLLRHRAVVGLPHCRRCLYILQGID